MHLRGALLILLHWRFVWRPETVGIRRLRAGVAYRLEISLRSGVSYRLKIALRTGVTDRLEIALRSGVSYWLKSTTLSLNGAQGLKAITSSTAAFTNRLKIAL